MNEETLPPPRPRTQRTRDTKAMLHREVTAWVATYGSRGPHLVPLVFHYDGDVLTFATFTDAPTVRNIGTTPRTRVSLGHPYDVAMIDGTARIVDPHDVPAEIGDAHAELVRGGPDPRRTPGLIYLQLEPERIQAWRTLAELPGRTVMRLGRWLP